MLKSIDPNKPKPIPRKRGRPRKYPPKDVNIIMNCFFFFQASYIIYIRHGIADNKNKSFKIMFAKAILNIKPSLCKIPFSISSRASKSSQDTSFWKQSDKDIFESVDKAQKKIKDADAMKKAFQTD